MTRRVLVTGGGGFVGRPVLRELAARGHEVHAVHVEPAPPFELAGVVWHRANLLDAKDASALVGGLQPDSLLCLAWYAVHGKFWTSPENLEWVGATLDLVRAFREAGGVRFVGAGSCAEYAWGGAERLSEQKSAVEPATLYGVAKDATRRVVAAYARDAGLSWAWGRIFFLHGPGEPAARFVAHVARTLLDGGTAACTHGRQVRDFLHVDDVARAFVAIVESPVVGPVNVASGRPVTLAEVANTLCELAGRGQVELGALPARPDEPAAIVADVARLRDEVGFRPSLGLRDGLARTLEWTRTAR